VFVLSRHGDRSPISVVPTEFNDTRIRWNCSLANPSRSLTTDKTLDSATGSYFLYADNDEGIFGSENGSPWHGNCQSGQLTRIGGEMCTRMGAGMRDIYVDKFHLLPDVLTKDNLKDTIYVRSTDIPRTRESLTSVLEGLYPADRRQGVYIPVTVYPQSIEYIAPNNIKCPRIEEVMIANVMNNKDWWKKFMSVKDILDEINNIAGTKGDSTFDNNVTVSAWSDVFRARSCHNLPYPCTPDGKTCVTQDMVDAIIDVGTWETSQIYAGDEIARLGAGSIFADISKFFEDRVSSGKGPKYIHYSAHDVSISVFIAGYTGTCDIDPAYASSVRVELWQTGEGQYAVQTIYNNNVIRAPECDSDMCPLDQYLNMIKSRLTINDVKKECARQNKTLNEFENLFLFDF